MSYNSNLFLTIGKDVKDAYGRYVGEIVSFAVKPNGIIEFIYIRGANGQFLKYPVESIRFNGEEVTLVPLIKVETEKLCNLIPLIWRKDQVLKELFEKNKISPEVYENLHASFEGVLTQLKSEAQNLIERIKKEIDRCDQEIYELNYALVHLEVEHEIGKVPDSHYEKTLAAIQDSLKKLNAEKADLEYMRSGISNMLLGETPQKSTGDEDLGVKSKNVSNTILPEPPAIIYVKEVRTSSA
ncbi:MAG: CdvA-like protein [Candidatus Bathyarchaeota archaeon]|nr:CdvA-like protein [Candidatus Bathyarchaeota archaeon]MCX8176852.1 CdvA-like protein [Candidatus Bathyarchaeota archaeon]MDW8193464.1 CdvA-like protein [Nitrososphaerota archaeon]